MDDPQWLAEQFEAERPHLRAAAYRMLGSLAEAEDAVLLISAQGPKLGAFARAYEAHCHVSRV